MSQTFVLCSLTHNIAYSHTAHSHQPRLAPPIFLLCSLWIWLNNSSWLLLKRTHTLQREERERTTISIKPSCNATAVVSPRPVSLSPTPLPFPSFSHSYPFTALSFPSPPIGTYISFYPQACPRCPQLWGNVRRLPPTSLLAKYAYKHTHIHRTQGHRQTANADTALLKQKTTKEISLVWGSVPLIFASLWSWWDLLWHSLAHARESPWNTMG